MSLPTVFRFLLFLDTAKHAWSFHVPGSANSLATPPRFADATLPACDESLITTTNKQQT